MRDSGAVVQTKGMLSALCFTAVRRSWQSCSSGSTASPCSGSSITWTPQPAAAGLPALPLSCRRILLRSLQMKPRFSSSWDMQTPQETSSGESGSLSSFQICFSEEEVLRSFSAICICCLRGEGMVSQRSLKWRGRCYSISYSQGCLFSSHSRKHCL